MGARHAMHHADAAWLRMDRVTNLMVINSVMWLDAAPDWDAVRAIYQERLIDVYPRFRQRPRTGLGPMGPVWEDVPDFDPEAHIHRIALPEPRDGAALRALVGDLASQPLDHDRPLWEVYLIDGYGEGAAILSRIHHAIGDGIALGQVMMSLTDGAPFEIAPFPGNDGESNGNGSTPFTPVLRAAELGLGAVTATMHAAVAAVREPVRLVDAAERARQDAETLGKLLLPWRESSDALKAPPHVARRAAWSEPYDLWRVKGAAHRLGVTINDILVAAVSGALASHLEAQGTPADEVHAMVPFNLRPLDRPVPRELGNRFGLVLLALPLGTRDRHERLWTVRRRMLEIKRSDEGPITFGILDVMGRAPQGVERLLVDYFTAKTSLVLTNVPGPRRRVRLAGAPVGGVLVWAPCSGSVEMSVSLFSYAGKVTVGFLVDSGLIDDPQPLADAFRGELRAYTRLARAAEVPGDVAAAGA